MNKEEKDKLYLHIGILVCILTISILMYIIGIDGWYYIIYAWIFFIANYILHSILFINQ